MSDIADEWEGTFNTINEFCEEFGKNLQEWGLTNRINIPLKPSDFDKKRNICLLYTSIYRACMTHTKDDENLQNVRRIITDFIPVSYTHLDVYKRQKYWLSAAAAANMRFAGNWLKAPG